MQEKIIEKGLDAAVIRTMSTFIYITGIKWLRPSLIIPAEGDPTVLLADGEEDGFREMAWIKNVLSYSDGSQLMGEVVKYLKDLNAKKVGMEYAVERDAFIFFYDLFKKLNRNVEVVDITDILDDIKVIKDRYEIDYIMKAGEVTRKVAAALADLVREGMKETDIAAEAYYMLYKAGSEEPLIYINAGPNPRVHSEPLSTVTIRNNSIVTITLDADFSRYYVNKSLTIPIGNPGDTALNAIKCMDEAQKVAVENTRPGTKFIEVMEKLDETYKKYDMLRYRVIGYAHSVGLKPEEMPITTIVPKDRFVEVKPYMVLALGHAPLMIPGIGSVKIEETYVVDPSGNLIRCT
ncbi:MAG: Xaa-Pro peptidase family protein [Thermoplasma acidophilum]|nr:Xaa-Pro peptidase family protein [Thermoplasma acidophilum]